MGVYTNIYYIYVSYTFIYNTQTYFLLWKRKT